MMTFVKRDNKPVDKIQLNSMEVMVRMRIYNGERPKLKEIK